MSNDDLLRMAKEAGFHVDKHNDIWQPAVYKNLHTIPFNDEIQKFAALVHDAGAREALAEVHDAIAVVIAAAIKATADECIKECETVARYYQKHGNFGELNAVRDCYKAIRTKYHNQTKSICAHEWVDARNAVVQSGEVCLKCNSIREGNQHPTSSGDAKCGQCEFECDKHHIIDCATCATSRGGR